MMTETAMNKKVRAFLLLLVGKAFIAECARDSDPVSARFSALIQVVVLLSLNLLALVVSLGAISNPKVFEILSSVTSNAMALFSASALLMFVLGIVINRLVQSSSKLESEYKQLAEEVASNSPHLVAAAWIYPYLVAALFIISVFLAVAFKS
jgi:hypothetical protein